MALFLIVHANPIYDPVIYVLTSVLILSIVLTEGGYVKSVLRANWLVWLGTISYSIYMSHLFVVWGLSQTVRVMLHRPDVRVGGRMVPEMTDFEAIVGIFTVVGIVLLLSHVVYNTVEAPLRKRSRQLIFGAPILTVDAAASARQR
jgi:peptidoglycan/LPS O-acetylase OafA/YrhL